ncbi:hypothetical protein [Kribbella kalugense]|uniref:Uncharacterized protein n=1 Tax=Kribbella kalugense TaxID=2512221 RepID=A0A4R7ZMS0_9ACTN|nr:hypothetical protein [Kribbella kalugense]TDW18586.1 hypothetical protein EV650_5175 [Kribbella kalugense]
MNRRTAQSLEQTWADRLGIDSPDAVGHELAARFEHLSRFVLTDEMPPRGELVSAEAATAYGELWVLAGFLADAKEAMTGEEDDGR